MGKIGGWEEEHWVDSRFAACMWIFTKAVSCSGQNHMQHYRLLEFRSIMEAVDWVCDDAVDEHTHGYRSLPSRVRNLANPCIVQWRMLWFFAPTSFNNDLLNDGVILEKYNEAGQFGFPGDFCNTILGDAYAKILFPEIDTSCVGQHALRESGTWRCERMGTS